VITDPSEPLRLTRALADRYAIERELGRGGMATVYLAKDLGTTATSRSRCCTRS
jgi:serine/threonine protein kinase